MEIEKINSILAEFNLDSVEKLSFEITAEMTEEELRVKLAAEFSNEQTEEQAGEDVSSGEAIPELSDEEAVDSAVGSVAGESEVPTVEATEESGEFSLLHSEKSNRIWCSVKALSDFNIQGSKDFWFVDYDDNYVYVGYSITTAGEVKNGHARLKYSEVDSEIVVDGTEFEEVHCQWLTAAEIKSLKDREDEYKTLVEYKENKIEEERKNAFSKVIEEFADLSEVEEYKAVVGSALEFADEEALREKLFALRGKYMKAAPKKPLDSLVIGVNKETKQNTTLETVFFGKYLPEALNKNNKQ